MAHAEAEIQESIYLNIPQKRKVNIEDEQKTQTIEKGKLFKYFWVCDHTLMLMRKLSDYI